MKFSPRVATLSILALLISSCDTTEVRKAMVHFERAFIPVLIYALAASKPRRHTLHISN